MKQLFTLVAALVLTTSTWAQVPEKMSYQAVIRNASNTLTVNQSVGMQISILQGGATGTAVYVETQTATTNTNGLVSLEIGTGTIVSGSFNTIDWGNDSYFIKTETDPTGGTTYTITGTTQLMSVPYALYAKTSGNSTPGPQGTPGVNGIDGQDGSDGVITAGTNITITGSGTITSPYVVNSTSGTGGSHYLGEEFGGGIIYHLYKDAAGVQHGLIVNKNESTAKWQTTGTLTNAERTENGAYNTNLMTNSAAKNYVNALSDDGFTDWFLPSVDELDLLYYNRYSANKALRNGSYTLISKTDNYWSSTESNTTVAYGVRFDFGYTYFPGKSSTLIVRAIRAF